MNNTKLVRLIAVILAAVLVLSLLVTVITYVASGASPETELEQLRKEAEPLSAGPPGRDHGGSDQQL